MPRVGEPEKPPRPPGQIRHTGRSPAAQPPPPLAPAPARTSTTRSLAAERRVQPPSLQQHAATATGGDLRERHPEPAPGPFRPQMPPRARRSDPAGIDNGGRADGSASSSEARRRPPSCRPWMDKRVGGRRVPAASAASCGGSAASAAPPAMPLTAPGDGPDTGPSPGPFGRCGRRDLLADRPQWHGPAGAGQHAQLPSAAAPVLVGVQRCRLLAERGPGQHQPRAGLLVPRSWAAGPARWPGARSAGPPDRPPRRMPAPPPPRLAQRSGNGLAAQRVHVGGRLAAPRPSACS